MVDRFQTIYFVLGVPSKLSWTITFEVFYTWKLPYYGKCGPKTAVIYGGSKEGGALLSLCAPRLASVARRLVDTIWQIFGRFSSYEYSVVPASSWLT